MQNQTCPYVGLLSDPDTHMAYASRQNCCFRADPSAPVKLEHQQKFCLSAEHRACPMMLHSLAEPLPDELSIESKTAGRRLTIGSGAAIVTILVLLLLVSSIIVVAAQVWP